MIAISVFTYIEKLFHSLKNRYQNDLRSMKGSEFVFDYVQLVCHKCHEINRGGSYVDSLIGKKQKSSNKINPINKKDNKCFQ